MKFGRKKKRKERIEGRIEDRNEGGNKRKRTGQKVTIFHISFYFLTSSAPSLSLFSLLSWVNFSDRRKVSVCFKLLTPIFISLALSLFCARVCVCVCPLSLDENESH